MRPFGRSKGLTSLLPSSKLIIILENADYIAMLKEKLIEIKQSYGNLKLAPLAGRG
jgi:hypothetical protein